MTVIDDVGLLCLAVDSSANSKIVGRTRLQKTIYFCKYLGWDVSDYKLHYYGPFSFGLADTVKTAESSEFVNQGTASPYIFSLTEGGKAFLKKFVTQVCDSSKAGNTRSLVQSLSDWTKKELELAATLDFVKKSNPEITNPNLITKVGDIKNNFSKKDIVNAYEKLIQLKTTHSLN